MHVAVIGGGWAGCAAAVELVQGGHRVSLFEAARTFGGRARRVELNGQALDNGQHILLGAYSETLRLMQLVGIDTSQVLLRLPLQMRYPDDSGGMDFIAPRLPAPLHLLAALLRADGLQRADKLALARFSTTARWMGWQLHNDCSVTELLDRFDQTERLNQLLWRPLCIAALNTPPQRASAKVFLNVLRDSLGARRVASDMLIPRTDLSALFPLHATAFIAQRGGHATGGMAVTDIQPAGQGWRLKIGSNSSDASNHGAGGATHFDAIVVATPASQAASLLQGLTDTAPLTVFDYEAITTCYLQYDRAVTLARPFFALVDDPAHGNWGQFVFDRSQLDAAQAGLLSVVISASGDAIALGQETLSVAIAKQLATVFRRQELAHPVWTKIISEKRATFACTPDLPRPPNDIGIRGIALAGDYTASDYPATLESAVRSGVQAAHCLMRA